MSFEFIKYDVTDAVATITLNRPDRLNAWTRDMMAEMMAAVEQSNDDPDVGAIIMTGEGRGFCAGADIGAIFKSKIDDDAKHERDDRSGRWVKLVRESKPMIAAINGPAIGVGLSMILPFDYLIASDKAKLCCAFVRMGVVNELASSHFLVERMGFGKASELALSARTVDGAEAYELSLVDKMVPADDLMSVAMETAARFAQNPSRQQRMIKDLLTRNGSEPDIDLVMEREYEYLFECYESAEHKEAVSAFMEKRPADFRKIAAGEK
jgi:2-(1,2-epoxy-1,2-dihydrophenyl)acetyl-CoA isomerase